MTLTFKQWAESKAKAIVAAVGFTAAAGLEALVVDPATANQIERVLPATVAPFVPIVLAGIAATVGVHQVTNRPVPAAGSDNDDLMPATTAVPTIKTDDGVAAGNGR